MRINSTGSVLLLAAMSSLLTLTTCQDGPTPLTAEVPLHLEDHLDTAVITGSELPSDVPEPVEWRFDEPQPDWKPLVPPRPNIKPAQVRRTKDSLRITLTRANSHRLGLFGGIYIRLPDWRREEWADVLVRARTSEKVEALAVRFDVGFNPRGFRGSKMVPVIRDGTQQTYVRPVGSSSGPWQQLGIAVWAREPAGIEILSVSVVPKEARFADAPLGVKTEARDQAYRRTLYTHAPSKLEYRVRVPEAGRLDVGLGVLRDEVPVTFRVTARPDGQALEHLLDESYSDNGHWGQRSVDLAHLAGKDVTLALEAEAERAGTIALWAAPTLSGARISKKPNVIFYIIDSAEAGYMSAYGYNRRTTPNIERLAAEGALFENAYSNSSWTRPSTLSFLTGLQHSAMGGMKNNRNTAPEEVLMIQEHLHNAGFGVCTSLPTTPHLVVGRSACRVGVGPSLNRSWAQRSRPVVQAGRRAFPGDESVVD